MASDTNKRKGLVFDMERFAVHDGNGIRTTVFLKGCPLRCKWCQNPEGMERKPGLIWRRTQCIHCHSCQHQFEQISWDPKKDGPLFPVGFPDCEAVIDCCPAAAIEMDAYFMDSQTVLHEIEKDRIFFRGNGGVTFSGGEPLMQADFLEEIIPLCHEAGIHTAIETSLQAPESAVKRIMPLLDQIFFDLKIFDQNLHQRMTGVPNQQIKENAIWILNHCDRNKVTVRTPLIPGCTAMDENIEAIASFLASIDPTIRYELLNYNPLASSKYALAEKEFTLPENLKPFSKEQMEDFRKIARNAGLLQVL